MSILLNKPLKIIVLSFIISSIFISDLFAQQTISVPVVFTIRRATKQLFNDTIMLRFVIDFESTSNEFDLSGAGALSLCGCYCDSLWDAWPSSGVIPGTIGTATAYITTGNNPPIPRNRPRNGSLGILYVEGGINRSSEFVLGFQYKLD